MASVAGGCVSKEILDQLDKKILDLKTKLYEFEEQRSSLAYAMVTYALNSAPSSHRVCCGPKALSIHHGWMACEASPTGKCVYKKSDEYHHECLFCQVGEDDKQG